MFLFLLLVKIRRLPMLPKYTFLQKKILADVAATTLPLQVHERALMGLHSA